MSKSLLKQLYDGDLYPVENIRPKGPECRQTRRKIEAEWDYFKGILPESVRERAEELAGLYSDLTGLYEYEGFACGFRLAAGLMAESFAGDPSAAGSPGAD